MKRERVATPPRAIALDGPVRAALARVWISRGRPSLVLDVAALTATKLKPPDYVVAVLVAEGRPPGRLVDLTETVVSYYEALGSTEKLHHVAFDELPSDPSEPVYATYDRKAPDSVTRWDLRDPSHNRVVSVMEYLEERWGEELDLRAAIAEADIAAFAPRVDTPPPPAERRVKHAKFGIGVVRDRRDGKLTIDFGANGVKVLAEKFVEDA